jgi:hypothetical protein
LTESPYTYEIDFPTDYKYIGEDKPQVLRLASVLTFKNKPGFAFKLSDGRKSLVEENQEVEMIEAQIPQSISKIFIRSFPMSKGEMLEEIMFSADPE